MNEKQQFLCASEIEERSPQPHPITYFDEPLMFPHIVGGVIDSFDAEGHKEVIRRIALICNKHDGAWCTANDESCEKQRVLLVSDEEGRDDFLYNNVSGVSFVPIFTHASVFDTFKVKNRKSGKLEDHKVYKWPLESRSFTQQLIDEVEKSQCTGSPITTVVTLWQDGHDKYLKMFADALPGVDVYNICYADPTGQRRSFARRYGRGNEVWDTQSEVNEEPDLSPVIQSIANEGESTWIGANPKVGKTWVMLCILLALLTGLPLFGDERLRVPRKAKRCIYLCPEAGRRSIKKRLKMLKLVEYLYDPISNPDGKLYLQTLSKQKIALTDTVLLELAKGADIFIDTAVRYLDGDENSVKDAKVLTENILNLLAVGARSVWVAHHSIKGFENASNMTLQNMFRGSGEFGAALTNAYGLCTEEAATTKIRFHCITGRDLDEHLPDMILQGRPHLFETGNFKVIDANATPYKGKGGAPGDSLKQQKIEFAQTVKGSMQDKAEAVNERFGTKHSRSTIHEWLKETSFDAEVSHE